MTDPVPPVIIFVVGALLVPFIKGRWKSAFLLAIPVVGFINLINIGEGTHWVVGFLDYRLVFGRVDRLSLLFGYIFHIISFIAILYSLHVKDNLQHMAGLVYAGSALGAIFAGDLFSFFVFWEMLTVSSIFLIWARRTNAALGAGFRYLLVHAAGGLCLLAGIVLHVNQTGSIQFGYLGLNGLGTYFIFFGFGLNCAWPILHTWLTDAYPEATITGTIFLSAFTTKVAVYALARAFPGTEALIWIGAIMTGFPIFYAVIENDLRRVLAYSLINQVGFMVCGIGIGTALAINGAVCHAFNDILFKALLFMSMGAIMYRTGKINGTDLGGLYKTMPLTCVFCMVGAASISAFPLFSGFVSKSMVMDAAAGGHMRIIWFILLFASAGVFHHAGIKIPYFAFFSHDSGMRPKEAPIHMLLAMGIAAFLSVFIGVFPGALYSLLPYPVEYVPYTAPHVVGQTQLLFFSALAFTLLLLSGIYPAEMRCVNLDADWFYRKGGRLFFHVMDRTLNKINRVCERVFVGGITGSLARISKDVVPRFILLGMVSFWVLTGSRGEVLEMKKTNLYNDFLRGTLPVGIGAGVAGLFIILLFVLS
ncbi:MAG: Na(+)/H(+) antiporter subunit D [Desulfobacterales bacterium]|nr:Na(+)/H(+) antiporter subunit D [Desulfobacterales bacterium]MBU0735305.1 Na(+)/H(+) antiporter subunit D [Pseudomonadota bacterium]